MLYGELAPLLYLATATTAPPRIRAFSRWVIYCYDDTQRRCLACAASRRHRHLCEGFVLRRWREWARKQAAPPKTRIASTPSTRREATPSLPSDMIRVGEELLRRRCVGPQLSRRGQGSPTAAADGGAALGMARQMLRDRERRHEPAGASLGPLAPQAASSGSTTASSAVDALRTRQCRFATDPAHRQASLCADNDARRQRQLLRQQQAARREAQISEAECMERAKSEVARWQRLMTAREEARKRGRSREAERRRAKALRLLRELVAREARPRRGPPPRHRHAQPLSPLGSASARVCAGGGDEA